jgi:hypothetical protein
MFFVTEHSIKSVVQLLQKTTTHNCQVSVDTDVSGKHAALHIFIVDVWRVRNWLHYKGMVQKRGHSDQKERVQICDPLYDFPFSEKHYGFIIER